MRFTVEDYAEFFWNISMNDSSKFPYTIEVVNVSRDNAVICVTAK